MLVLDDELLERFAALEAEVAKLKGQADKDWYDLNGVCAKFRLSKDKVKSRQWGLQNNGYTTDQVAENAVNYVSVKAL